MERNIWAVDSYTFTFNASQTTYALPDDLEQILFVSWQTTGSSKEWLPVNRWRADGMANISTFNTTNTINIYENIQPGRTVRQDSTGDYYLQISGSYSNNSRYVRVKSVNLPTPGYFSQTGVAQNEYTASLPLIGSASVAGAFGGSTGAIFGSFGKAAVNFFESIPNVSSVVATPSTNIQGIHPADYAVGINLLENNDEYDFNVIYAPGLTSKNASSAVSDIVLLAQNRGDAIAVVDMVGYGSQISPVIAEAVGYDNSYAATYWPWVQIRSRETGKVNFVPASTLVPAVYEYNDKVSAEWFAPAGAALRATFIVDPDNVIQHVTVNNLNVGRSPEETLRVLDALQTGELCACNRTVGGETL